MNIYYYAVTFQQVFSSFYDKKTTHRKLQWAYTLGNASVKGVFGTGGGGDSKGRSFEFQVVTLQAIVMLAFNNPSGSWTFEALLEEVKLPEEILKKVVHSLACGKLKVLKKSPAEGNSIRNTDSFSFNDQFT